MVSFYFERKYKVLPAEEKLSGLSRKLPFAHALSGEAIWLPKWSILSFFSVSNLFGETECLGPCIDASQFPGARKTSCDCIEKGPLQIVHQ